MRWLPLEADLSSIAPELARNQICGGSRHAKTMARKPVPQAATRTKTPESLSLDQLTPPSDRDRVDRDLQVFFEETRRAYAGNPHLAPLFGRLTEFVLRGGKRLRPRLCLASYRILSGRYDAPPPAVVLASSSLEVFHAFMLVHDDLIDGSITRRNRSTLHEAIRHDSIQPDLPSERKRAADLGLIGGDLLFSLGMRLLSRSGLDDCTLGRANRLMADMLFETGLGEALDVLYDDCPIDRLTEDQIVESYLRKTARYSVSGPLTLGATIAGAHSNVSHALDRFGDLLGFGFQVQNDLDAFNADITTGDHPDLDGGKRTYVLWAAYRGLHAEGRRDLVATLADPIGLDRRRTLRDLIDRSGALDWCRSRLDVVRRDAITALAEAPLDSIQRRQFVTLTSLFGSVPERTLELINGFDSSPIEPVAAIVDNGLVVEH